MRRLPSASEIAKKARELSMEAQARHMEIGDPLTPTEAELKESGFTHEARISLMQSPETRWQAEQRRYIHEMAEEMGYKVITKKEYRELQKLMNLPRNHKHVKSGRKPKRLKREFAKTMKKTRTRKIQLKRTIPMKRVSLRMPLDIGSAIRGKPKPIPTIKAPPITAIVLGTPKRKKRKKNHSGRVGKTMRKLRKPMKDGKKMFAFPDHVWKVRKP